MSSRDAGGMIRLRPARPAEAAALSALVMRSKAYWGYDAAFLEKCREPLALTPGILAARPNRVALVDDQAVGFVMIDTISEPADLLSLFVEPAAMGRGVGRALFDWAESAARAAGHTILRVEADPGAVEFYRRCGAVPAGWAISEADPDRRLPVLERRFR